MSILHALTQLLHSHSQPQRRLPDVPMGQDPKNYGYPPEITYNPNPRTNIPYSTHNLPPNSALAKLLTSIHRPSLQAPANLPIGGFQNATRLPMNSPFFYNLPTQGPDSVPPLDINQNDFRDTRIRF